MQLLNIRCFQLFKHYHVEVIDNAMRWGDGNFGMFEFLAKFQTMRTLTFKKSTIQSAFRNTGLIPYNPGVVHQKVRALPRSTWAITLPPPNPTNKMTLICNITLHRPHEIKNQAHTLINSMRKDHQLVNPKFQPYLDRFICGSVTNSLCYSFAKRNLQIIHRKAIAQAAHKKFTRKVAQKGGVIIVRDMRANITKRVETEVKKARKALDQAEAAELEKENARIVAHKNLWKQLHKDLKAYLKVWPASANLLK